MWYQQPTTNSVNGLMLPMTPHQLTILTITFSYTKSRRFLWLTIPCTLSQSVFKGLSKNASSDHLPRGTGMFCTVSCTNSHSVAWAIQKTVAINIEYHTQCLSTGTYQ
ncbi:hypothetical protein SERLA73DRAFT_190544, partial [Serpula lacrymans var. lacrymans S7.3]